MRIPASCLLLTALPFAVTACSDDSNGGSGEGTTETPGTGTSGPSDAGSTTGSEGGSGSDSSGATAGGSEDTTGAGTSGGHGDCVPGDCGEMVAVPAGSFAMGCPESFEGGCVDAERPEHSVMISAFEIGKYEVTQEQYEVCVAAGACESPGCDYSPETTPLVPVVCVNWDWAEAFCEWAGGRLPTEAEWEMAARGVDGRSFPWGDSIPSCGRAVMNDASGPGCGTEEMAEVGSKPDGMSPFGLLDVAGNAAEWVADWFDESYYAGSPTQDPPGPDTGEARALRGASYLDSGNDLAAFRRSAVFAGVGQNTVGFRCARAM